MKYLKFFEEIEHKYKTLPAPTPENYPHWIFIEVGDEVEFIDNFSVFLKHGKKYEVVKVYTGIRQHTSNDPRIKQHSSNSPQKASDKIELLIDVKDPETGEIFTGYSSEKFHCEFKEDVKKYNL